MLSFCGLSEDQHSCLHIENLDPDNYLQIGSYVAIFTSPDGKSTCRKLHNLIHSTKILLNVLFMTWREKSTPLWDLAALFKICWCRNEDGPTQAQSSNLHNLIFNLTARLQGSLTWYRFIHALFFFLTSSSETRRRGETFVTAGTLMMMSFRTT